MQTEKPVELSQTEVVIPNARLSYPSLFRPTKPQNAPKEQKPKYAASLIIKKSDTQTVNTIKRAIHFAAIDMFGSDKAKWPKGFKNPLQDGDSKGKEEYSDSYYINASSFERPVVIDQKKAAVAEEDNTVYAGCYVNAFINFYGYTNLAKGVAARLNGIQKYRDGEPFSSRKNAQAVFEVVDDGVSEEPLNDDNYDIGI